MADSPRQPRQPAVAASKPRSLTRTVVLLTLENLVDLYHALRADVRAPAQAREQRLVARTQLGGHLGLSVQSMRVGTCQGLGERHQPCAALWRRQAGKQQVAHCRSCKRQELLQ